MQIHIMYEDCRETINRKTKDIYIYIYIQSDLQLGNT